MAKQNQEQFSPSEKIPDNFSYVYVFIDDSEWSALFYNGDFYLVGASFTGLPELGPRVTHLVEHWTLQPSLSGQGRKLTLDHVYENMMEFISGNKRCRKKSRLTPFFQEVLTPGNVSVLQYSHHEHEARLYKIWHYFLNSSSVPNPNRSAYLCSTFRSKNAFFLYVLCTQTSYELTFKSDFPLEDKTLSNHVRKKVNFLKSLPLKTLEFNGFNDSLIHQLKHQVRNSKAPPGLILIETLASSPDKDESLLTDYQMNSLDQLAKEFSLSILVISTTIDETIDQVIGGFPLDLL